MKFFKKYKISIIVLLILMIISLINYFISVYTPFGKIDTTQISSYSFWFYTFNFGIGSVIGFLSQVIIPIVCVYSFFNIIKTGFIQNVITRMSYKKYIFENIVLCYKKAILLFPLFSVIMFIIASFLFTNEISNGSLHIYHFPSALNNPLLHVFLSFISITLYSFTIVGITIILSKYFNKFYIVLALTLMSVFLIAFVEGNFVSNFLYSITDNSLFYNINIYDDYFCARGNFLINIVFGIIRNIILIIVMYFTYRDSEKVVLNNV